VERLISVIREACRLLDKDEVLDFGINSHFKVQEVRLTWANKRPAVYKLHRKGGEQSG